MPPSSSAYAQQMHAGYCYSSKLQQGFLQLLDHELLLMPIGVLFLHYSPVLQEILHVMAPHYVHMFEGVFSRPRPWLFGHLYLPGGSKNLGAASYELSSGSRAPLIGTLAQVTRAVRLRDGKFLILATAITRFKVRTQLLSCSLLLGCCSQTHTGSCNVLSYPTTTMHSWTICTV